jgi:4-alpha-glucanotransferase
MDITFLRIGEITRRAQTEHKSLLLLLLLFTAIGFSPGGSSPYTSTGNTNGNIIYIKVTIQNKLYTITKQEEEKTQQNFFTDSGQG